MIWILGEYAERIDNSDELIDSFLETFAEETPNEQLQLLTATVKLFLKRPNDTQEMVQNVLHMATEESDNPDLRDRGYVYWRLLSSDPEAAKAVVLGDKPVIDDDTYTINKSLLNVLLHNIASLASVYHTRPETFIQGAAAARQAVRLSTASADDEEEDYDDEDSAGNNVGPEDDENLPTSKSSGPVDLLDMGGLSVNDQAPPAPSST